MTTYKPAPLLGGTGPLAGPIEDVPILRCPGVVFNQHQHHDPEISRSPLLRSWLLGNWGGQHSLDSAWKIFVKTHHRSTLISTKMHHPRCGVRRTSLDAGWEPKFLSSMISPFDFFLPAFTGDFLGMVVF